MRLIDADDLIHSIDTASDDLSERLKQVFIEIVAEIPTAYDVEKVVAELKEKGRCYARYSVNTDGVKSIPTYEAIDIVRKGGGNSED